MAPLWAVQPCRVIPGRVFLANGGRFEAGHGRSAALQGHCGMHMLAKLHSAGVECPCPHLLPFLALPGGIQQAISDSPED